MRRRLPILLLSLACLAAGSQRARAQEPDGSLPARPQRPVELSRFFDLLSDHDKIAVAARSAIATNWRNAYAVMLVELAPFAPDPASLNRIISLLEEGSAQAFGTDTDRWYDWIWRSDPGTHPKYAEFKATLYATIDPRFREYFDEAPKSAIRLDEIRWGGVARDGIPPLEHPKLLSAGAATYLKDDNVVFGVEINGDARAYPQRILGWHEMVKEKIGGEDLHGVYCTLCGTMILYRTTIDGTYHELGTSGFLYRSNKLMYDHATKSLWSTLTGQPVVGPLVGQGLELKALFVVTTTWGEWRRRHPQTKVLSLNTGHRRNYGEGEAYREYFATDHLMFNVPKLDARLPNKAEVLALRFSESSERQLAIAADFLRAHPLYHAKLGKLSFVVLTDASGANRVYETRGQVFSSWDQQGMLKDSDGNVWALSEATLWRRDGGGSELKRLPAHRAFWFGWYAAYPNTRLIK